jgi:hypothetical protein
MRSVLRRATRLEIATYATLGSQFADGLMSHVGMSHKFVSEALVSLNPREHL